MNPQISKQDLQLILIVAVVCLFIALVQPIQFSVLIGESMEPTIEGGDIIVYTQYSEISEGDIIVFNNPNDVTVGHRVIEVRDDGYIAQGDNNDDPDPYLITEEHVEGKVIYDFSTPF